MCSRVADNSRAIYPLHSLREPLENAADLVRPSHQAFALAFFIWKTTFRSDRSLARLSRHTVEAAGASVGVCCVCVSCGLP